MKKGYKIAVALTTVLQAGISAVVPAALCIILAKYLMARFDFPQYTMLIAILLGVASGFYSMINYIKTAIKSSDRKE